MRSEKKFWELLISVSALFIILFTFFLMKIIYPFQVDQMKNRARETVNHLSFVTPYLTPVTRQKYLEKISRSTEELSYLLIMDTDGNALTHSNPLRVGMNFKNESFKSCISTGERIEETYIRDADNPESQYHNEKTIDIQEPYYSLNGKMQGVVCVGISLRAVEKARQNHIIISAAGILLWILFIFGFAFFHIKAINKKKKAEVALAASEEKYRFLVENSHDIACTIDLTGIITFMGPQIKRYGINPDEAINSRIDNYIHPEDINAISMNIMTSIKHRRALYAVFRLKDTGRGEPWFELKGNIILDQDGRLIGFSGIMRDITERKLLEEQLFQSQKMDVIGQLAGGIAHDFNNMLGGIIGSAELLSIKTESNPSLKKLADIILKSAERAAELTGNLLAYSRKGRLISKAVDIHEPITEAILLLERTINKSIIIKKSLNATESRVTGDPSLLQNAFMNLGLNARDAMPDGGVITYRTANVILDEYYCLNHPDLIPGAYVEIDVSDTGTGISEEIISRIFEPFFTTKEIGRGTGLGLAAVYGTVKEHHGEIRVYSETEKGTIFKMYLPLVTAETVKEELHTEVPVSGSGVILLIDDEAIIRNIAQAQLTYLGYDVFIAEDGETGIELFKKEMERISLVIVDFMMPEISGQETLKKILEISPETKVLLSSGFNYQKEQNILLAPGAAGFIQKPYQLPGLSKIISEILSR